MNKEVYSNIIADDDQLTASIPDVPLWNETVMCMFEDTKTGISSLFYLGRWWGHPTTLRAMVCFMLPNDRAVFVRNYGPARDGLLPSAAGLTMTPNGDGTIHYTYKGPADIRKQSDVAKNGMGTGPSLLMEADFTFTPAFGMWDLHAMESHDHAAEEKADLMFPGGHMEQLGSMTGTVKIGDEVFRVENAYANRDHSRGVRDFIKHHSHIWIYGRFPSGWGFCSFRASTVGVPGYSMNTAVVFKDGKLFPGTIETEALHVPGSDIWKPFTFTLKANGLDPIQVNGSRLWNFYQLGMYHPSDLYWGVPTGKPNPAAYWSMEQSVDIVSSGEVGTGHIERCNRDVVVDDAWRSMCTPEKIMGR
jgi:hypothetical protein